MKTHAGKFKPGVSGNPRGRPKGVRDRRVALREALAPHAVDIISTVVNLAKAGDPTAMRLCMERMAPPVKEEAVEVSIPKIESADDCVKAQAAVLNAAAAGEIMPSEARLMADLIEAQRKAYETHDLAKRLEAIEDAIKARETRS